MFRYVATLLFAFSAVALGDGISRINGSVRVDDGQRTGDVSTVNGSVTVGRDAQVGDVDTVNGDVFVGAGSRVDGGIHVEENRGWFKHNLSRNPKVTIESGAVVRGPLHFEREVDLYLGAGASIGKLEGVAPHTNRMP